MNFWGVFGITLIFQLYLKFGADATPTPYTTTDLGFRRIGMSGTGTGTDADLNEILTHFDMNWYYLRLTQ